MGSPNTGLSGPDPKAAFEYPSADSDDRDYPGILIAMIPESAPISALYKLPLTPWHYNFGDTIFNSMPH